MTKKFELREQIDAEKDFCIKEMSALNKSLDIENRNLKDERSAWMIKEQEYQNKISLLQRQIKSMKRGLI
jgi:hypothetical protein